MFTIVLHWAGESVMGKEFNCEQAATIAATEYNRVCELNGIPCKAVVMPMI